MDDKNHFQMLLTKAPPLRSWISFQNQVYPSLGVKNGAGRLDKGAPVLMPLLCRGTVQQSGKGSDLGTSRTRLRAEAFDFIAV